MKKAILFSGLFFFLVCAKAQQPDDKSQMEKERQQIQKEINDLEEAYRQVKGQKSVTLGQANVIKRKIELQERYLGSINKEIRLINDDIYMSSLQIVKLQKQLDTLKNDYSKSVVYAYKNHDTYDFLNFIFSAVDFNDALKRISYLKSYRSYREQQVNNIKETQRQIEFRKQDQLGKIQQKKIVQQNETKQVALLEDQKKEKDAVIAELKSNEKGLKKEITAKQKRSNDLQRQITAIIEREMNAARKKAKEDADRLAREEAAKKTTPATVTPTNTNPVSTNTVAANTKVAAPKKEESILTFNERERTLDANFERNRGQLPWPVDQGFVSEHFGTNIDEITHIKTDNPGITISTPNSGTAVKVVFDGTVTSVFNLGDGLAVMIQHGKYFTIYSNLSSSSVVKGQSVTRGQVIGKTAVDEDGSGGKLDFMLMKEKQKVNPQIWLSRK